MHQRGYLAQTIEPIIDLFIQYLTTCSFENFKRLPSFEIWKNKRFEVDPLFRNLAIEILTIPSSEAAVERLFRYLSGATQINLKNQFPDIIKARLIVKFDSLFGHARAVPFHLLATPENYFIQSVPRLPIIIIVSSLISEARRRFLKICSIS